VELVVNPESTLHGLNDPTYLGLPFEAKPNAASNLVPNVVVEAQAEVNWRYEP
jgi:hypothetical protein